MIWLQRREFITLLGGARPGRLRRGRSGGPCRCSNDRSLVVTAFHRGLLDAGYFAGWNIAIEYRWAAGRFEQLPALAADLVSRQVAVIAAISGTPSALAAEAGTTTIPIVFAMGSDPVEQGLVASVNRPGSNVTGASFFTASLGPKRLELLREVVTRSLNETPRVHYASWWHGSRVAAGGTRAATGDAGDRAPWQCNG